jgi:hypothetical protein
MIENFMLVSAGGQLIRPNITGNPSDSLFEFASDDAYREYVNNARKGLRWDFAEKEINFFEETSNLFGLPTPDLKRVVIIYPYDHAVYPSPGNAVVYNEDGSIHLQLKIPELISPIAMERKLRRGNYDVQKDASFRSVHWRKDVDGNLITVLSINFDWEWWESRVLNPDTGEFGECISSGRR